MFTYGRDFMLTNSILCIFNFSPRFETTTAANYKRNQSNKEAHDAKTKSSTESERQRKRPRETNRERENVINKARESDRAIY